MRRAILFLITVAGIAALAMGAAVNQNTGGIFDDSTSYYVNPTARSIWLKTTATGARFGFKDSLILFGQPSVYDTIGFYDNTGVFHWGKAGLTTADSIAILQYIRGSAGKKITLALLDRSLEIATSFLKKGGWEW